MADMAGSFVVVVVVVVVVVSGSMEGDDGRPIRSDQCRRFSFDSAYISYLEIVLTFTCPTASLILFVHRPASYQQY